MESSLVQLKKLKLLITKLPQGLVNSDPAPISHTTIGQQYNITCQMV